MEIPRFVYSFAFVKLSKFFSSHVDMYACRGKFYLGFRKKEAAALADIIQ